MKKKLFSLLTLALFAVSSAWADDFSAAEVATNPTGGTTKNHVTCSSSYTSTTAKKVKNVSNVPTVSISNSADDSHSSYYIQIQADAGYTLNSPVTLRVASNNSSSVSFVAILWEGDFDDDKADAYRVLSAPANSSTTEETATITFDASTYRTIRVYRRVNYVIGDNKKAQYPSSGSNTINIASVTATAAAACTDVAAPTGLSCTAHTKSSLTFGWTAASDASSYDVYLYSDAECTQEVTPTEGKPYNVTTTSATLTGLGASKTYYCKVQSKGDGSTYCAEGGVTSAANGTTDNKDYTVTAASNNALWGTAAAAAGSLDEDETTEVAATPESGYKFVSWAVSGEGASLSSTTDNPTTLTMGTANATVTATFRALYHYTITYNKGTYGDGDDIADGDKTEDVNFTLSSSKYTRDGYVQTGWATSDGGSKAYDMGGSYTANEDLDLYPVWTAPYTQRTVSGLEVWDWADATGSDVNLSNTTTPAKDADADIVAANFDGNIYEYDCGFPDNFDALVFYKFQRPKNGTYYQGQTIKIKTSVPGIVTVKFANTGNKRPNRYLQVNGTIYGEGSGDEATASQRTVSVPVAAGDITLTGIYEPDEANYSAADGYQAYVAGNAGTAQYLNFYKVEFAPTVTVAVGGKGYATYCNSDYALDFTDCSIQPYVIACTDGSTLTLTNKKKIAKNEPVLLYSSTNSDSKSVPAIADGDATADGTNKLVKGDNAAHTWVATTAEHYVLATATVDPGFYRANNNTVASNKAYLDLTGLSGAHSFTLDLSDGAVTGIATVSSEKEMNNASFYNLAGQKIVQPTKGLYIVNGKKVIIK